MIGLQIFAGCKYQGQEFSMMVRPESGLKGEEKNYVKEKDLPVRCNRPGN